MEAPATADGGAPTEEKPFSLRRPPAAHEDDASKLELGPEFSTEKAQPLFLAEAAFLLSKKAEEIRDSASHGEMNPVLRKACEYAERFDSIRNPENAMSLREQLAKVDPPLHPFEIAQLATLAPDETEEARAIIPSLSDKYDDEQLGKIVASVRSFTQ